MQVTRLAAAAAVLALAGCGGGGESGSDSGASNVRGVTDTEIILGSQTDLSGPAALLGVDLTNGARMAFDDANAAGGIHGRQIRFVVEDSQYQLPKAIQATNKLVNRDNIFAMILGLGTPMNNATMQTLMDANVPNVFPVTGSRTMTEPFRKKVFAARGIYYDEIRAGVKYFVEQRGAEKVCAIYQDSDYGIEILEGAQDQLAAMGMELVATSAHKPLDTDFTAAVLKLRNAGCEVVMMGTIYKDTMLTFQAARKIGWDDVAFVGQNAAVSKAVAEADNNAADGYYAFVHIAILYEDTEMTEEQRAWFDRYTELFGKQPDYASIEGYRNGRLVVEALERAGPDLTVDAFVAAMESINNYSDLLGYRIDFAEDDHSGVSESILMNVQDGRWVVLEESVTY